MRRLEKGLIPLVIIVCVLTTLTVTVYSEERKKDASIGIAAPAAVAPGAPAPGSTTQATARPRRSNFVVIFGSVTKIDKTDPAKPKLEVKSDIDNKIHIVDVTPWTNITKVTDVSELKAGDTVRVMVRKVEGRELAMTVVFGKIKNIYRPRKLKK